MINLTNENLVKKIAHLMTIHHLTLSTAESCTGGLIAHTLTNVSGSSKFFDQGVISYSNASKVQLLEVQKKILTRYGAVSAEVAQAMAVGIRKRSHTDIGLATTGIAGPTGGTKEKPVGLVYIALATSKQIIVKNYLFTGTRLQNKKNMCTAALQLLFSYLENW